MIDTFFTFLQLAWRNLWRNPRRTVITLIVVSVGLWSILAFDAFLGAWVNASKDVTLGRLLGEGQIHAKGYLDNPGIDTLMPPPDARLRAALNDPRIGAWSERLALPGVVQSEYKSLPIMLVGVDPAAERKVSSIPGKVVKGRYLKGPEDDAVVLGQHMVKRLSTGLGRRVILMTQGADGTLAQRSFDVVGLYEAGRPTEDFYAFTGLRAMQKFVSLPEDRVSGVVVTIPRDKDLALVIARLHHAASGYDVRSWKKLSLFLAATDSFMKGFIYIWLGVVFAMMAIGIINTQLMAVFERTREFGLLRALGMKPRLVLFMVSLESALLIGVGVVIGMGLAVLTIWAVHDGIDLSAFANGLEMVQVGQVLYPKYDPARFVIFSLAIWGLGLLVSLWPAWRASRASPVEAMRHIS